MENTITLSDTVSVTLATKAGLIFEVKGDPKFGSLSIADESGMEASIADFGLEPSDLDGMIDALSLFKEKYFNIPKASSKSRKSKNAGALFSRIVSLSLNAYNKGVWSNGAVIDRSDVINTLIRRFEALSVADHQKVTDKALASLQVFLNQQERPGSELTSDQIVALNSIEYAVSSAHDAR